MAKEETLRLFIGAPLDHLQEQFCRLFVEENEIEGIKWIPEKNWHITMLFLGNFQVTKLNALKEVLKEIAAGFYQFGLSVDKFTYMPNPRKPTMIWQQYMVSAQFDYLLKGMLEFLKILFFDEGIPFNVSIRDVNIPHVTLSRLNNRVRNYPRLKQPRKISSDIIITGFTLYASELNPGGAKYTVMESFRFS